MSNTIQTIQVDSNVALNLANTLLPVLEKYSPAVAGDANAINLGITAAQALLPLLSQIHGSGLISAQDQAIQLSRVYAILSGNSLQGKEWIKQV